MMFDAAELIRHVPIVGSGVARYVFAPLHVAVVGRACPAVHVRTDCGAGDRTADGRDVAPASAPDLMAENAADDAADDRARDAGAAVLNHLLALDPATLFGRADHRAHRGNRHVVEPLVGTTVVIVALLRD